MHPKPLTLIEMSKNQPPHFLCVTWILLRLMAPAIRAAPSVLLKHCYYLGKCQGRPGSHLIFCLPKTAANALKKQKNRARNVPHTGRKPDRQNYRMWHWNEKLAIMQSASPSLLRECTLCVRARRVMISSSGPDCSWWNITSVYVVLHEGLKEYYTILGE